MSIVKRLVARTPIRFQEELKRLYFRRQIKRGRFVASEPEYAELSKFVSASDWVIDVGANIGHYTVRFSELVGANGRVFAFEPIPTTFTHLSENVLHCEHSNVTLINAAASDKSIPVSMAIPEFSTGLKNYYRASISSTSSATDTIVMALPIDYLRLEHRVSLIKIDAEGHESSVLSGAMNVLKRDKPMLIVEAISSEAREQLFELGYTEKKYAGSPNSVFRSDVSGHT